MAYRQRPVCAVWKRKWAGSYGLRTAQDIQPGLDDPLQKRGSRPHYEGPSKTRQVSTATPVAKATGKPAAFANPTAIGDFDTIEMRGRGCKILIGNASEIGILRLGLEVAMGYARSQVIQSNSAGFRPVNSACLQSFTNFDFQVLDQAFHLLRQAIQPSGQGGRGFCALPMTHPLEIDLALQFVPPHRIGKTTDGLVDQHCPQPGELRR